MRGRRGGARKGAGRKPILGEPRTAEAGHDDFLRELIGSLCEERWRDECEAALVRLLEKERTAKVYEELRGTPVAARLKWSHSEDLLLAMVGELEVDFQLGRVFGVREDLKLAVEANLGMGILDDSQVSRFISYFPPRPKGKRKAIIEQVAKQSSAYFGRPLSRRFVETCWKEFRRLERSLSKSDV
jgi:hypothetical protein